ncbi:MAG: DNA mismatch repair protein MutS [Hyphomicrobiaceae bacterium]
MATRGSNTDVKPEQSSQLDTKPKKQAQSPKSKASATPSMAQYLEIKAANPDSLLWYRMGDFYELFFDDAVVASQALNIVLTKRGKHLNEDIPMCGVPVVRADEYLQRLIRHGFRVAVCEQLEDPAEARKRGSKAVVHRDVVRLVTPGTLTEDALLDASRRNYLTAIFRGPGTGGAPVIDESTTVALASLDISTGEFEVGEVTGLDLPGELTRLSPGEVLASDALLNDEDLMRWIDLAGAAGTPLPAAYFESQSGVRQLKEVLGVSEIGGFGDFTRPELAAIAALLKYIDLTQIGKKPLVRPPRRTGSDGAMLIDASSRASLELVRSTSGEKQGSLLSAIDRTVTGPGARELASRLASPLRSPEVIRDRLDAVSFFIDASRVREDVRTVLRKVPDIARAISRLAFGRAGPRDLGSVRDGCLAANEVAGLLQASGENTIGLPTEVEAAVSALKSIPEALGKNLQAALVEAPPHLKRDGAFVREGYRKELDEARQLKDESRQVMADLEARYIEMTGVKKLKIRHNNILGYFIEVSQLNAGPLQQSPLVETFRHRQTMANAMRFTTVELAETEGRISTAGERALALENEVFNELAQSVMTGEHALGLAAAALGEIDVLSSLAELAETENYARPLVDDSRTFVISGGRHPVVEQALAKANSGPFVDNDCCLGRSVQAAPPPGFDESRDPRIWLVTGPNMAGKSTFLRQNALIAVLAQMGSYVPAREAHIGVVDRLFSRVGAADDLARGRSTFMVEMVETASILNQATARSLVILDEIGRGTATFDGLSIAWATLEYLHEVTHCRALFATHYHELTALPERLNGLANVTIEVKEWHDDIVFLHKVVPGAADRSYGIQVAKLAGLPQTVVERAGEVLAILEDGDRRPDQPEDVLDALPLFAATRPHNPVTQPRGPSEVEEALDDLSLDDLTPKAALDALYKLKALKKSD